MRAKAFLVFLLFVIWSVGSGWYYVCTIKQKCSKPVEKDEMPAICFSRGEEIPQLGSLFPEFQERLVRLLVDSNLLQITGLHSLDELHSYRNDNLGFARAVEVQKVLTAISSNRIVLGSEVAEFDTTDVVLNAVKFKVIISNEWVTETEFGAIVYVGLSDLEGSIESKVDAYLTFLAKEYNEATLQVVGHTAAGDDEVKSFEDALKKAEKLRELLIARGAKVHNVVASSKGQTEPLADNMSASGRVINNRVEIFIK